MFHRLSLRAAFLPVPRLIALAIGIALGVTLVAGVSLVAAERGDPQPPEPEASYQVCVNTFTGVLRLIQPGQQCQDHETLIQLGGSASDAALLGRIEELEQQVVALQAQVPDCLSTDANADAIFEGCNVYVQSGSDATDGAVNGEGNLIIGYNEAEPIAEDRSGSHNLVIGTFHSYSSYGGLVAGSDNAILDTYASVSGGFDNTAGAPYASVSGGSGNKASANYSSVSGGDDNEARGTQSSVSGGEENIADGAHSSVSGGFSNEANFNWSAIGGGVDLETTAQAQFLPLTP